MSTKQQSGTKDESAQTKGFVKLVQSDDFKEFFTFAVATATLPAGITLNDLSED